MSADHVCSMKYLSFSGSSPAECLLKASKWFSEHENDGVVTGDAFLGDGILADFEVPAYNTSDDKFYFGIAFQRGNDGDGND